MLHEIQEFKRKWLLDVLRRVVANPQNAERVANYIAEDWFPLCVVEPDGNIKIGVEKEAA